MTPAQIREAKSLLGKMSGPDIAKRLGVSISALKRAFRGTRIAYFNKWVANPELTKRVCEYYEEHGRAETEKAFPNLRIRSAVERYKIYKPRQIRWTDEQLLEVARMAGIVSLAAQAKWFNRPGANVGAMTSVWHKRFGLAGGTIHGMAEFYARHLVTKRTPYLKTAYWQTRRDEVMFGRKLCLWVDMENNMRRETPEFIRGAVKQMADFQRWLFKSKHPKRQILRIIAERELS